MAEKQVIPCFLILVLFSLVTMHVSAFPSNRIKSLSIIREVNRQGPYLGLITVYPPEENSFFATGAFKPYGKHPFVDLSGRRFRIGKIREKKVIYVRCGVGMVNAAAATQQMVDMFDVKGIVHFGIAGNVNNSMSIGDVTIPKEFAHTGIWDWLNPDETLPSNDIAQLEFGNYNVPEKDGMNLLGHIGYNYEQFYYESGKPNSATPLFWAQTSQAWLQVAAGLEGMELEKCVNSSSCLPQKPKLVVGLKGSTANIFVDNAAYRDFLYQTFAVSSVAMESASVVMVDSFKHSFLVLQTTCFFFSPPLSSQPWQNGSLVH
ncbi:mta/sah nucleosidase, putative [Ricinus communis]|uniref:Mta/sah nucleosidase, putative n=1 Tax=Ricinus communis TaxID=3988 RepID=B9T6S1_RICCO|nr:mta/sah nucleosidase, putative [Ricinus communis]